MPQSLAHLHVHLVFSTKGREPWLTHEIRPPLHGYVATVLRNLRCRPIVINSVHDHLHGLFDLARTVALSDVVQDLKSSSSKWIKTQGPSFAGFAWQAGYGAFAVSESQREIVHAYIAGQEEHHRQKTFQEEYQALLERHRLAYDERYVWD